jgi:hypothetical protein
VPGDIVFSIGPVLLAVFAAKLWLAGRGVRRARAAGISSAAAE